MSIKQKIKVKESFINLEEDKVDSLANTNDMKELSEQVIKFCCCNSHRVPHS